MKSKIALTLVAAALLPAAVHAQITTIADWTFETSQPATAGPFNPEVGSGSALGFHSSGSAAYSTPVGNGSAHSFSANTWSVNDYYQFKVSTATLNNIIVTYSQTSSSTGPGKFQFEYSTDGVNFTALGGVSTIQVNGSPNTAWTSSSANAIYNFSNNLSSITALNNASAVYFRLVDTATTSSGGGTVGTAGTDRVDNFTVLAAAAVSSGPGISSQPANEFGLLDGTVKFAVVATGSSLQYQWYYSDASGNLITPVTAGAQANGSVILGVTSPTLSITNAQPLDANNDSTNFVVVVTGTGGTTNSIPAALMGVDETAILSFWNFNGPGFLNNLATPQPYFGTGTALAVGTVSNPGSSPFSGSVDAEDGIGGPFPAGIASTSFPNYSWGTSHYPEFGTNKGSGIQFNVSTVGAKNITVSYDSRPSSTGSMYERLQYTTDGLAWIDYPTSSQFQTHSAVYFPFSYNLTGFSNVANNPNFGVRVVTEFQTTATYGVISNDNYVGAFNTYTSGASGGFGAGTITYDIVNVSGSAITNTYAPPTITGFADVTTPDYIPVSFPFIIGSPNTPVSQLTVAAQSLQPGNVNPNFVITGTGSNLTLNVIPNAIPGNVGAGPIEVTVTDTNGDATAAWFYLTLTSVNLPPTNSLTVLPTTNMLANGALTIPFVVTDDRTPTNGQGFTYSALSDNNTLVPDENIVVTSIDESNAQVTITPATNQIGTAEIAVMVSDNDLVDPKTTTAYIRLMVRPNTNIVLIDYFDYDTGGSLDSVAAGFWNHLTGGIGQEQLYPASTDGFTLVDTANNTENVQVQMLGAPFLTNNPAGPAVLYSSYIVNMNPTSEPNGMPNANGSYFTVMNDGSGNTGPYECRVLAATNGAAPGLYRLGIDNFGSSAADGEAQMYPVDLVPGSNYVVVTSLVLANGVSSLWINPTNQASFHVTDNSTTVTLYNISDFELRESGAAAGAVAVGALKVGTSFDSVFPQLQIQSATPNVVVNWSDPTLGLQSAPVVTGPWTDVAGAQPPYTNTTTTNTVFFRFKQ